jgi:hypothetical protein
MQQCKKKPFPCVYVLQLLFIYVMLFIIKRKGDIYNYMPSVKIEIDALASVLRPHLFGVNLGTDEYTRGIVEGSRRLAFQILGEIYKDNPDYSVDVIARAWQQLNQKTSNKMQGGGYKEGGRGL